MRPTRVVTGGLQTSEPARLEPTIWLRLFGVYRLHQVQRGSEEWVAMLPVPDPHYRTDELASGGEAIVSQSMTNESLVDFTMQKRKLENFELRPADEPPVFRPENWN
jgi:hypothetical protein